MPSDISKGWNCASNCSIHKKTTSVKWKTLINILSYVDGNPYCFTPSVGGNRLKRLNYCDWLKIMLSKEHQFSLRVHRGRNFCKYRRSNLYNNQNQWSTHRRINRCIFNDENIISIWNMKKLFHKLFFSSCWIYCVPGVCTISFVGFKQICSSRIQSCIKCEGRWKAMNIK